jgi:hypothetical protein
MRRIALLSTVALLAACGGSSSSGTGYLRVGNLSPDLGPLDFCVATAGGSFGSPVMAGAGTAAASGLVRADSVNQGVQAISKYFSYPAGTYDVRVFSMTQVGSSCASPLLTATNVSLGNGVYKLIAAVGMTGATGAGHSLATFTDEATVATGYVAIRFANTGILALPGAAPVALPPIDVGVIPTAVGATYTLIFGNVAYPGVAAGGSVDTKGYAIVPAAGFAAGAALWVCPAGAVPPTVGCQPTAVAAGVIAGGTVASAYVIGLAGLAPNALLCGDNQAPPVADYPYSMCTTNPNPA